MILFPAVADVVGAGLPANDSTFSRASPLLRVMRSLTQGVRRHLAAWLLLLTCLSAGLPAAWAEADRFHMGFYLPGIRDANLADVRVSLQLWAEEVGAGYGLKAKAFMYEDMGALRRDTLDGQIDMVIAPGMEMAETFAPQELSQGFTGFRRDTHEGLALIVSRQGGVNSLADLRGKRLSRLSQDRLSDVFLDNLCLKESGVDCHDWMAVAEEKRDIQSIHKVFFGKADAALVRLATLRAAGELNPQIDARLQTLLEWKTTSLSFGLMNARSTSGFRDLVLRSALQAAKTSRGRQILELFKTDYMDRVDRQDLEPFWRLHREHQEMKRSKSTRKK